MHPPAAGERKAAFEGVELCLVVVLVGAQGVEVRNPVDSECDDQAINDELGLPVFFALSMIHGKRRLGIEARLAAVAFQASTVAVVLTSWSQLRPAGTTFLVVGIQNSQCALTWAAFMHSPARNASLSRGAAGLSCMPSGARCGSR